LTPEQLRERIDKAVPRGVQAAGLALAQIRKSLAWRWLLGKWLNLLRTPIRGKYLQTLKEWGIDRSWVQRSVWIARQYTLGEIVKLEGVALTKLLGYSQAQRPDDDTDDQPDTDEEAAESAGRKRRGEPSTCWMTLLHGLCSPARSASGPAAASSSPLSRRR
jgi:hypothetical protein